MKYDGDFVRPPASVELPPLMRPRGEPTMRKKKPVWSEPYYVTRNMLVSPSGVGRQGFERMMREVVGPDGMPVLPIDMKQYLSKENLDLWNRLQQWSLDQAKCQIFEWKPGCPVEAARDRDGNKVRVDIRHGQTGNIVRQANPEDNVFIDGKGQPKDMGGGKTCVKAILREGGGAWWTPIMLDLEQIWPGGYNCSSFSGKCNSL